jgi:hypothetical protein
MRDLLFKNLTSADNHRKILCSAETVDKDGIRTNVRRHFVYFVRQVGEQPESLEHPSMSVFKEHNTKSKYERFYCRMKGALLVKSCGKLFKINFMHSLRINLSSIPDGLAKYEASG